VNDPTRIRDAGSDVPDELRALFRGAAKPAPLTPEVQATLSSRVATIGAASTPVLVKWLPWLLGGAVALGGGAAYRAHHLAPSSRASAPVIAAPAPAREVPAPAPRAVEAPARAAVARPAAAAPARSEAEDALVGEARLLAEAQQALAANPKAALGLAREHARRYPRGQLGAERELIEIQAFVKLGRRAEAEARGRSLRRSAPNSIYEDRLDEILRDK
jgi:hypothetical protein